MAIAKSEKPSKRHRLLNVISRLFLFGAAIGVLLVFLLVGYVTFWPFEVRAQELTTNVLADDGQLLASIYVENRRSVSLDDVSPYFLQAVVAIEDTRFYQHHGIDFIRLAKVVLVHLQTGSKAQGASTLTQQVARGLYLSLKKTYTRKIQEAIIALQLEQHLSKDEILELYVNDVYMGHGLYGIQNAAKFYFGKDAKDLNLAQSALLAGAIQIPEVYSPVKNFDASRNRQKVVLNRMVAIGTITQEQADEAYADVAAVTPQTSSGGQVSAGYIKEAIVSHLDSNFLDGAQYAYRGGLTVQTTINRQLQAAAEKAVADGIAYLDSKGYLKKDQNGKILANVALIALDPKTGEVKAMVGGKNYQESTYNRVFAKRPPGSAFKPLLYAEALRLGKVTLATPVLCAPTSFEIPGQSPWQPSDFGGTYHNAELTVRQAIIESDNVIAAKVMQDVGPTAVVDLANSLGMELQASDAVLSLALGTKDVTPYQLAVAYAAFANGGLRVQPTMIQQVSGPHGELWETISATTPTRVLDERVAFLITDALKDVISEGTAQPVLQWYSDPRAAAKTGTTGSSNGKINSAWIAGYTPDLVTVVYIGADDYNQPITARSDVGGGGLAGSIWGRFMAQAASILPATPDLPQPEGVVEVEICTASGQKATYLCPEETRRKEYFLAEYAPTAACPVHGGTPLPEDGLSWWQRLFPNLFGKP